MSKRHAETSLEPRLPSRLVEIHRKVRERGDRGEEKSSPDGLIENPKEFARFELAERVGFVPARNEPMASSIVSAGQSLQPDSLIASEGWRREWDSNPR